MLDAATNISCGSIGLTDEICGDIALLQGSNLMILFPIVIIHGVHGDPIFLPIYCVNSLRLDEDSRNKRLRVKNNQKSGAKIRFDPQQETFDE